MSGKYFFAEHERLFCALSTDRKKPKSKKPQRNFCPSRPVFAFADNNGGKDEKDADCVFEEDAAASFVFPLHNKSGCYIDFLHVLHF